MCETSILFRSFKVTRFRNILLIPSLFFPTPADRSRNSVDGASVNGHQQHDVHQLDFERLKQEILVEVRKELMKTKNEIIEGEFSLLCITIMHDMILLLHDLCVLHAKRDIIRR